MFNPEILCVIVSISSYSETLKSIINQTVTPKKIIFSNKKFNCKWTGERAGMAMRDALNDEDLTKYTHILRVDGDTTLPKNFIEENLKLNVDVTGWGYSQLFTTSFFKNVLNNVYPVCACEDSLLAYSAIHNNCSFCFLKIKPVLPSPKKYSKESWVQVGKEYYKFGYSIPGIMLTFDNHRSTTLVGFNVFYILYGFLKAYCVKIEPYSILKIKRKHTLLFRRKGKV